MTEQDFYVHCIEKAVAFVVREIQGDETPVLADIAAAAGLSKFHFHRIYQLLTGETVQQTITRLKLARGASRLQDPTASVTDAAFEAGYGSSQAFAKVLKRVVDQSATELRSNPERLATTIEVLSTPIASEQETQRALQVELASLEPFTAVAIRTHGRYPALNESYYQLFSAIGDPANVQAILGQPIDDISLVEEWPVEFICALKLNPEVDIAEIGLEQLDIGASSYLVTRHLGGYDGLSSALDRAYLTGVSSGELRLVDSPCLFHYLDDPEEVPEQELRTDVYLPVQRA